MVGAAKSALPSELADGRRKSRHARMAPRLLGAGSVLLDRRFPIMKSAEPRMCRTLSRSARAGAALLVIAGAGAAGGCGEPPLVTNMPHTSGYKLARFTESW